MFKVGDKVIDTAFGNLKYEITDQYKNYYGETVYVLEQVEHKGNFPLTFKELAKYAHKDFKKVDNVSD